MKDDHSDRPFFKDGFYIYSTGEMVPESSLIEGVGYFTPNEAEQSVEEK